MKVRIDKDDCHPFFIVPCDKTTVGKSINLTRIEIELFEAIEIAYWNMQYQLEKKYMEAK